MTFTKVGPLLSLGPPGALDSASASYGVTFFDGATWWMYYLGTQTVSPPPDRVPMGPYYTLRARSRAPGGPWLKQSGVVLSPKPGTYYDLSASPGFIVKQANGYLQFFSAGKRTPSGVTRTIGIARTRDLAGPWAVDPDPILPVTEQIENTSLYFQQATKTWFMFTNHVAARDHSETTDAIWVYWTQDLERWSAADKAIVLDAANSSWSKAVIGLPSVLPVRGRLAIFYDGLDPANAHASAIGHPDAYLHMLRDIGLAWLDLPIHVPASTGGAARSEKPR